jgi:hypothetical protein
MRCIRTILLLATATTLASCDGTGLDAARDLTGTWEGSGPTGASYTDNVANPNCAYEADIRIVFVQDGTSLTGSFTLTVTSSTKLLSTNLSCVPVGASNNEALFGSVNSSNVTFELFNTRTDFDGTFTSDILNASFASTLPGGIAGTMRVTRQ